MSKTLLVTNIISCFCDILFNLITYKNNNSGKVVYLSHTDTTLYTSSIRIKRKTMLKNQKAMVLSETYKNMRKVMTFFLLIEYITYLFQCEISSNV